MSFGRILATTAILAAAWAGPTWAQAPALDLKPFASSADIQALIANARKIRKPDQALVAQPVVSSAPYKMNLEYRTAVGPAAVHETEGEVFYVVGGTGTMVTGGKLTGEKRTNPTNLSGAGIEAGAARSVAAGDVIFVPSKTPHWFSTINGELILLSLHVPQG